AQYQQVEGTFVALEHPIHQLLIGYFFLRFDQLLQAPVHALCPRAAEASRITSYSNSLSSTMPDHNSTAVTHDTDVLIVGGGAAGLSLALKIAEFAKVT